MQKLLSTLGILALATTAVAQNFAIASYANNGNPIGGTTGNVWRAGINRVQCLYDSSNFVNQGIGQPITISNLDYMAGVAQAGGITYPSVDIYVGLAAVDHAAPSTTFANNRSASFPTTPNFSGPVTTLATTAAGQYFANIPLTVPFNYVPDAGVDLLVEIVINTAPTPLTGTTIDAGFNVATHKVNSVRSVGSTVALTGSLSAFCPTVRFTYVDVPGGAKNQRRLLHPRPLVLRAVHGCRLQRHERQDRVHDPERQRRLHRGDRCRRHGDPGRGRGPRPR
jgi:hypothetical protein